MIRMIRVTAVCALLLASVASAQIVTIGTGSPYFEDFEFNVPAVAAENCPGLPSVGLVGGWTNLSGDDNEWTPDNNGTPSIGTGPFVDQSGSPFGIYLYTEASGTCANGTALLESPTFDLSGLTNTQGAFSFWVNLNGLHSGSVTADLVEQVNSGSDGGATVGSDTFNSVSAAFTALHVGTQIHITGSAMGNDGTYTVLAFIDADNVQLDAALAATESGLSFTQTNTTMEVVTPLSGNQGLLWVNTNEVLINDHALNSDGSNGNDQLYTVIIRGTMGGGFQSDMAVDSFTFRGDAPAIDFSPTQILAPGLPTDTSCAALSSGESVTVEVSNNQAPIPAGTMLMLTLDVNGGMQVVNETFSTPALNNGDTTMFTFGTPVDLSMLGANTIDITINNADSVPGNNTLSTNFSNPLTTPTVYALPFSEDFDSLTTNGTQIPPMDWTQDQNDGTSDWFFRNTGPGSGNGPVNDHTTMTAGIGFFAHTEDSTGEGSNAQINLLSPCIDLSAAVNPIAEFWVNSNDAADEQNPLGIDVVGLGGIVLDVIPEIGTTNDVWVQFSIDMSPFNGDIVRLRFRGRNDNPTDATGSNGFTNDVGIDDIRVVDPVFGMGQPPQLGLATLDVNNCVEINGFPVANGNPGPYTSMITSPTPVTITMEGQAAQPIILLGGTLSVGAAPIPGVGQLDVDNPGLVVIGDGTQPAASFFNSFFITDATGSRVLTFPTEGLVGQTIALQGLIFNNTPSFVGLTNAVEASFL